MRKKKRGKKREKEKDFETLHTSSRKDPRYPQACWIWDLSSFSVSWEVTICLTWVIMLIQKSQLVSFARRGSPTSPLGHISTLRHSSGNSWHVRLAADRRLTWRSVIDLPVELPVLSAHSSSFLCTGLKNQFVSVLFRRIHLQSSWSHHSRSFGTNQRVLPRHEHHWQKCVPRSWRVRCTSCRSSTPQNQVLQSLKLTGETDANDHSWTWRYLPVTTRSIKDAIMVFVMANVAPVVAVWRSHTKKE